MFVPNKGWAEQLLSYRFLSAIGATWLATTLQNGIDNFFRHEHPIRRDGLAQKSSATRASSSRR